MTNYLEKELFLRMQEQPELFEFIREAALDGFWYWNLEDPNDVWMDRRFWETLGYAEDSLPNTAASWEDKIHPEDKERAIEAFHKHVADPSYPYDILVRYYHKEGHLVWIRGRGIAIRDPAGKPIRMLGAHNEVTALKRSEDLLNQASDLAKIGFWEINLSNQEVYWSKVTREIHEVEEDFKPDIDTGINFYVEGPSRDLIRDLVDKAIKKGEAFDDEFQIETAQGNRKWVRAVAIPELNKKRCVRLYGLFQDIDLQIKSKQALRSERELYRQVIQGANLGAWEMNVDSEEIAVNNRLAEIIGYDVEELKRLGYHEWFDLIHQEDRPDFDAKLEACLNGAATDLSIETRLKQAPNHFIWVAITGKIFLPNPLFPHRRLVGTVQDISAYRAQGNFLKKFIEENPLAMAMLDSKMRYITCSNKWYSDYGIEDPDIRGKSHYEVFPTISDEWKEFHRRCLRGETLKAEEDSFEPVPGKRVYLRWEIRPWHRDNGKVGGIIMFTENITDRVMVEEKLRISEKAFRGNFENAAIGMAILDKEGKWLEVNEKVCEITGYSSEELMKLSFQEITHPDDLDNDLTLLQELIEGKRANYQMEKRYIRKDGAIAHILLGAAVVRDSKGEVLYFISQIIDIGKRRAAELKANDFLQQSLEHNNRLNNFAHIVAHNLKTHSSGFNKLLEYLKIERPDLADSEALRLCLQAGHNLHETILDLNTIVEIQSSAKTNFEAISISKALNEARENLKLELQSGFQIKTELKYSPELMGIQAYLVSIFQNLISNAWKYQDPSKPEPYLQIRDHQEERWYRVDFEDNGLGIDMEKQKSRLFGMYNTFHEHPQARGMGLFLVRNQIEGLGGKIEVQSEPGRGSTFSLYLPYEAH